MKTGIKRLVTGATAAFLLCAASLTAFAADANDVGTGSVTGNVTINGTIQPLTISMTHPVNVAYAISPDSGTFVSPDINVVNNTKAAVTVTVQSLNAAPGGTLTFADVLPSSKTWSTLSLSDSKKYIALGVSAKSGSGWNAGYDAATHWAADSAALQIGSLRPVTTGALSLSADYGLSFDGTYTANHQLVFSFQLM